METLINIPLRQTEMLSALLKFLKNKHGFDTALLLAPEPTHEQTTNTIGWRLRYRSNLNNYFFFRVQGEYVFVNYFPHPTQMTPREVQIVVRKGSIIEVVEKQATIWLETIEKHKQSINEIEKMESTETEKLEKVLEFFNTSPFVKGGITDGGIIKHIKVVSFEQNAEQLHRILDKLVKDNFIKYHDKPYTIVDGIDIMTGIERSYSITFDGKAHYEKRISKITPTSSKTKPEYVNNNRLQELRTINRNDIDLKKLIRICEELNSSFENQNYYAVGALVRTIINHIPPIFGFEKFDHVVSNYASVGNVQSFKQSMSNLNNSIRRIADSVLHSLARKSEVLPNATQVDCKNDLDVLISEIIRVLNDPDYSIPTIKKENETQDTSKKRILPNNNDELLELENKKWKLSIAPHLIAHGIKFSGQQFKIGVKNIGEIANITAVQVIEGNICLQGSSLNILIQKDQDRTIPLSTTDGKMAASVADYKFQIHYADKAENLYRGDCFGIGTRCTFSKAIAMS